MQIIPIKDLRDTNKISDLCNESSEPIFITKNGYGDMVIMSIKTYEEKLERMDMYEAILDGLSNLKEGKIKDGISSLKELKTKYDLWYWFIFIINFFFNITRDRFQPKTLSF